MSQIYTVIAKPTRLCNADCSYCSSPPDGVPKWRFEDFKLYLDKLYPHLGSGVNWIWHGGEPMLLGPDFYVKCDEYAKELEKTSGKKIIFSMQSNLLSYQKHKWEDVFKNVFNGCLSTSFDPDEKGRTVKGNADVYNKLFKKKLELLLDDGFYPLVIGTFSEETAHLMHKMYDWSLSYEDKGFDLRFNYCHPSGRFEGVGEAIKPKTYAKNLIELYDRWIKDVPVFQITPLNQMFKKVIDIDGEGHCPWTKKCGGWFVEIEPNGDLYNCSEFADSGKQWCYGNLKEKTVRELLSSKPATLIKRRSVYFPEDCGTCEHFNSCEGGCMRDSVLFNNGLYGKFHYCESWKRVFTRIKESILTGEADNIIKKYGQDIEKVKKNIKYEVESKSDYDDYDWEQFFLKGLNNPFGFTKFNKGD